MKLFYNDDTPVEYEPPCFKTGNESDAAILNNVVKEDAEGGDDDDNLKVGALNTGFHG